MEGAVDSQVGIGDPIWENAWYKGFDAGTNLKSTSGWYASGNGTDLFGFSGLPGGSRYYLGYFDLVGIDSYWWTSAEVDYYGAWSRYLYYDIPGVYRDNFSKEYGFSVRCLQRSNSTTISGTAAFPPGISGDLSGSKVSIYTSYDNWNWNQPFKFVSTDGSGDSVTYLMTNILPDNYYLDVWKDMDNSGAWSAGDYVGWYGSGGLDNPELIFFEITQGQTLNLNIQMMIMAKGAKLPK